LENYDLVLASASARRAEILRQIGVSYCIVPANIDETPLPQESAIDYVKRMAMEKAEHVMSQSAMVKPILGADTCVVCDSKIFGKPLNQDQAVDMLTALSGRSHWVLTAVAVRDAKSCFVKMSKTEVTFRQISRTECQRYWETSEPCDKAGSYAIQGYGAVFVKSIKGSYSGVVGLPVEETTYLLHKFGIPVWDSTNNNK
jgi:septum formation protein